MDGVWPVYSVFELVAVWPLRLISTVFLAYKILVEKGLFVLQVNIEERNPGCSWKGKEGLRAKEVVVEAMEYRGGRIMNNEYRYILNIGNTIGCLCSHFV
ncbi:hypothetical protein VNO80_20292 [Phaseolus coccineus]|uniref:Uncharacterized protein n=1 Tax=Phaseolus coccineus TaxID=3886 RepID=A0AAN9R5M6_PHACN